MRDLTISEIAAITGGRLHGEDTGAEPRGLDIDSRAVAPGIAFAALAGEKTDGHRYISAALDAGAPVCLAQWAPEGETRPIILVPDVAEALAALAGEYRSRLKIPIVGVTGSVGKTTAKEMISAVLSQRFNTLKTDKNLNNELGVPLTIFRIDPEHEAAVIELGISHFGEMTRLGKMARPDIAVFTIIGHAHLEFLQNRQGVLAAKGELLPEMADDSLVCVNGDDDLLASLSCRQQKLVFGTGENCGVRAENIRFLGEAGTSCEIAAPGRRIPVRINAYGKHLVSAALAAACVGMKLGLSDAEIAAGIASYIPVGRRSSITETESLTIIDDCYNANPDSVAAAIDSAAMLGGRLVCILGDMLELGDNAAEMHRETGFYALSHGAVLITAGELAWNMGGKHFESRDEIIGALPDILRRGDKVLVKASHSMGFEAIADAAKEMKL